MTPGIPPRAITLGFHPTARGFGWAAFDTPFHLYDHGLFTAKKDKSVQCIRKFGKVLDDLTPETVVLEAFDVSSSLRSERIRKLCLEVVNLVAHRGIELAVYKRSEVQACFAVVGARTRDEIADAVARQVDGLRHRLPAKRKAADSEDKRLALFSAAAVVTTHFRENALCLLESIRPTESEDNLQQDVQP